MPLIDLPYYHYIMELLQTLDPDCLSSIASTATRKKLTISNQVEAIFTILRYTEDLPRFFSYKKITSQVLFRYLNTKNNNGRPNDNMQELAEKVKQFWESRVDPDVSPENISELLGVSASLPAPSDHNVSASTSTTFSSPMNLQETQGQEGQDNTDIRSDVFSQDFCRKFYAALNNLQQHRTADTLTSGRFMPNSTIDIHTHTDGQNTDEHASGQGSVYLLLKNTCINFNLSFEPNLHSGLQAEMSEHGLLKLYCVGTFHACDTLLGKFEQEFGLVQNHERKWKIKATKLSLKPMVPSGEVLSLPDVPVFRIPQ